MKKIVLLVDDEEIIRITTGEILEELGFEVITARDGNEGLKIFRERGGDISLVFMDITLPDMSGAELAGEMKKILSGTKFLLTSGYRMDMTGADRDLKFIQKPYTITELNDVLREILS